MYRARLGGWPAKTQMGGPATMLRFVMARFGMAVPTLLLVSIAVFVLVRMIPGDPAQLLLGDLADPDSLADMRQRMGLDKSILQQFFIWFGNLLTGDLGRSITTGQDVTSLVTSRFVISAQVVLAAVLFAALQQLEFLLPFDPWDNELWSSLWQEQGERVRSLRVSAQIASFVLATIGVFLAGVLTGVTRTLLREYDFRLDRTAKGFRRRRGLITRTDLVMPVHRVQAALVTTGFIRRKIGNWHGLKFVSLASDGAKSSNHAMAPFATMEEIDPIARIAGIALPDGSEEWHATSARYWFDRAALRVVPLLVLAAIIALAGETLAAFAPFAVALAFALGSLVKFRHYRHAAAHGEVFVRGGFLKPRLQVAPQYKLHTVEIEQSVLARWRGYATLNMGLAGGPMRIVGMPGQQAWTLRKDLLEKIVSTDFSQLPSAQPST